MNSGIYIEKDKSGTAISVALENNFGNNTKLTLYDKAGVPIREFILRDDPDPVEFRELESGNYILIVHSGRKVKAKRFSMP